MTGVPASTSLATLAMRLAATFSLSSSPSVGRSPFISFLLTAQMKASWSVLSVQRESTSLSGRMVTAVLLSWASRTAVLQFSPASRAKKYLKQGLNILDIL